MGFNDKHLSSFEGYRMLYKTEMVQFVFMDREVRQPGFKKAEVRVILVGICSHKGFCERSLEMLRL